MAVVTTVVSGHLDECSYVAANPHVHLGATHDLVSCSADGSARLWDLRMVRSIRAIVGGKDRPGEPVSACHDVQDQHLLHVAWANGSVCSYDLRQDAVVQSVPVCSTAATGAEMSALCPNGRGTHIVGGDDNGAVYVWEAKGLRQTVRMRAAHGNVCTAVVCHPTQAYRAYSGGLDGHVVGWDSGRGKAIFRRNFLDDEQQQEQVVNPRFVHALAINGNGTALAVGLGDGSMELCCPATGRALGRAAPEDAHGAATCQAGFFSAGDVLYSAGNDSMLVIWRWSTTLERTWAHRLRAKPNCVALLPGGQSRFCVAGAGEKEMRLLTLKDGPGGDVALGFDHPAPAALETV